MSKLEYQKYRWFVTSTKKLVVGGKSALQNDELLKKLEFHKKNYVVAHTSAPGSPFSVILSEREKVTNSDIEQVAIFTACFSQQWKQRKAKSKVDIFTLAQLSKKGIRKQGLWHVNGKIKHKIVPLELVLTKQRGKLRAVPPSSANKKNILLRLKPGKIDKQDMLPKLELELNKPFKQGELLQALPPGGVSIKK